MSDTTPPPGWKPILYKVFRDLSFLGWVGILRQCDREWPRTGSAIGIGETSLPVLAPAMRADASLDHRAVRGCPWHKHAAFCTAVTVVGFWPVVGLNLGDCRLATADYSATKHVFHRCHRNRGSSHDTAMDKDPAANHRMLRKPLRKKPVWRFRLMFKDDSVGWQQQPETR